MTNNVVGRFAGGSPAIVAVRLIVVSFVVGIVLETFGFDPTLLLGDAVRAMRRIVELGFTDIRRDRPHPLDRRDGGGAGLAGAAAARTPRQAIGGRRTLGRRSVVPRERRWGLTRARRADPLGAGCSTRGTC